MARRKGASVNQAVREQLSESVPVAVARLTVLRVRTVARVLSVRRGTVFALCRQGVFPGAYRTGEGANASWRIPARDVEAYQHELARMTRRHLSAVLAVK